MTVPSRLQVSLWIAFIVLCLILTFTAMFFSTDLLYSHIGQHPPALLVQIINSLGGLLLFGLVINILTHLMGSKHRAGEWRIYGPIIDAMEKIAKGDFRVEVENIFDRQSQRTSVVGELINSVNRMALELNQMETMRQEFISNVSHEIQSPLTSIRGFAQTLRSNDLSPEERDHYLKIIETESTRLSILSDNLLKLASLEARQVKFAPHPYRLDRQIRNLILACEPQWMNKTLDMDVSLEEVTITADEDLLYQVWLNLLHNSIKFTPCGGTIRVTLSHQKDTIECTIADTGIGIAEEDQAHIFERFYKADQSRQRSKEGSGLGLSIVKKIIEMHQGDIKLKSKLDSGTTFYIYLPTQASSEEMLPNSHYTSSW